MAKAKSNGSGNPLKFDRFVPGNDFFEEVTAGRLNGMLSALESLQIIESSTIKGTRYPNGTLLKRAVDSIVSNNYVSLSTSVDADDEAFVTAGLVDNNHVEIDGTPLSDNPPPSISVTGSEFYLYLILEWEPGYSGVSPTIVADGGSLVSPVTIAGGTSMPSDVPAVVSNTTGAVTTNGKFHFKIAVIEGSTGAYGVTYRRTGNRTVILCGDDSCRPIWDSP